MDLELDMPLLEMIAMRDELFTAFQDCADIDILESVIGLTQDVASQISPDHHLRGQFAIDLLIYWDLKFQKTQTLTDLHQVILHAEDLLDDTPHDHPSRSTRLGHLSYSLHTRYQRTQYMKDLNEAILYSEQALATRQRCTDERTAILKSAYKLFQLRFTRTRQLTDLHGMVVRARDLMQVTGSQGNIWSDLGTALGGGKEDRERAITAAKRILAKMGPTDPGRGAVLSKLSTLYYLKYQQTEGMEEIRLAISYAKNAIAETPPDSLDYAPRVENLSTLLDWRLRLDPAMHDLGIIMDERLLAAQPESIKCLGDLATKLYWRHEQTDDTDKARAAMYESDALGLLPEPDRAGFLRGLQDGLDLRCQAAVSYARVVLESLPDAHPDRGPLLADLADRLFNKYVETDNMERLQQAISCIQEACAHKDNDRIHHINHLSTLWAQRYKHTHALEDLQKGIRCSEKALTTIPRGHPLRLDMMYNQAARFSLKFHETQHMDDLHEAIRLMKSVLADTPPHDPARADVLISISDMMALKYQLTRDVDDMRQVVPYAREALATTPEGHPDRAHRLNGLATKFYWRYKQTALLGDIRQAGSLDEEALRLTDLQEGAPSRALYLSNLATMRHSSYQRSGSLDDISAAISLAKEALLTKTSPRDPIPTGYLVQLARYYEHRYNHAGDMDDVRQCVLYGEEALNQIANDHPARVHLLAVLSRGLSVLCKEAGDWSSSRVLGETAAHLPPPDWSSIEIPALHLGTETPAPIRTTAIEHLQQAISYSNEALEVTPHDHPDRSARMQLADMLRSQYEQIVTIPDINQALFRDEEALAAATAPHPDRHRLLGNLIRNVLLLPDGLEFDISVHQMSQFIEYAEEWAANSYDRSAPLACLFFRKYLQTKDGDDLEQAIVYNAEALAGEGPRDRQMRRVCLTLQAITMLHRYQDKGDIDDLERAISYGEENLSLTIPEDNGQTLGERQWVDHHGLLAGCFCAKFSHTGDMADLDREIQYREQSLTSVPPGRVLAINGRRRDLSRRLKVRYDHTQQMADLNRAIWCGEEGYELPTVDDATNLYILLMRRYQRSGDTTDLEQCIPYAASALDAAPLDDDEDYTRAGCLMNLAGALENRYMQYHKIEDLTRAISLSEESVALVPEGHQNRPGMLANMFGLLGLLYTETRDTGDLDRAMRYGEEGLSETKDLHARAGALINMGNILHSKFNSTSDVASLQQAILYAEKALGAFPADHPARGMAFLDLGDRYLARAHLYDSPDDLDRSVFAFKQAVAYAYLMPSQRVRAARGAAAVLILRPGGAMEAYSLLEGAILLLPEVSPRSLASDQLLSTMNGMHGLAADAASAALEAGVAAAGALKLLEMSRGIMAGIAIDCRSDILDLSVTDPGLFNQFNNLRVEIDTPLLDWMAVNYRVPMIEAIRRRREAVENMADLIANIRNLPGHEGFQLPLSPAELMSMAADGAIVTFCSSSLRSDAIIVTTSSITSIPLPKLSFTELETRLGGKAIAKLSSGTFRTYGARNNSLRELLLWLWNAAVWPVLQELKLSATAGSDAADLPHICWIGTGLLGVAPFHAAGDYSRNADPLQNTMCYAVSSYTPTIKALSYAREKDLTILGRGTDSRSRMLLVTMPVTPGEADLPDVELEVESILDVTKGSIASTHLAQPSADEVLRKFESFAAMHLACHGISDANIPSRSHLVLLAANGSADPLNIRLISRRNTATSAQVVYLSACSTAESTGVQFADESHHIASGFQLAGFSHVLAAMWSAESKVCVAVSTEFYRALFDGRGEGHRKVRTAFHQAVKKVQEQHRRSPLKWAPFVHMGA